MARRRKKGIDVHGVLLLHKRSGLTSNRALQEIRTLFNANKAGHTGSLDPLATGLLPLCFGEATKISHFLLDQDKCYQVVAKLGRITDTGDAEGKVLATSPVPDLDKGEIEQLLHAFMGSSEQIPPMYSALKHQGRKLYELARAGLTVERRPRSISIYQIECQAFDRNTVIFDVHCSKGTYIRTLVEDLGKKIGCGAMVQSLHRTGLGCFNIDQAWTAEQLFELKSKDLLQTALLPVDRPLQAMPAILLQGDQADYVRHGGRVCLTDRSGDHGLVRMYCNEKFLGIGEIVENNWLAPKRVFHI